MMNSDNESTVAMLGRLWQTVPGSDAVIACVQEKLGSAQANPPERTTAAFNRLLSETAGELWNAAGLGCMDETRALGVAVTWLGTFGGCEDFLEAFLSGSEGAIEDVVYALRDACLGRLQVSYRQYLLYCHCGAWEQRCEIAAAWLASLETVVAPPKHPWELEGNVDEILESVGASRRLLEHLRHAGRAAGEKA